MSDYDFSGFGVKRSMRSASETKSTTDEPTYRLNDAGKWEVTTKLERMSPVRS